MKWRWYRSLILWSGLLVMGFISWAWWASCHSSSEAMKNEWYVGSHESGITFGRSGGTRRSALEWTRYGSPARYHALHPSLPFVGRGREDDSHEASMAARDAPDRKTYYHYRWAGMPKKTVWLYIPYWLIMAVAGAAWVLCLAWRWRSATADAGSSAKDPAEQM